jgi:hypothetical protein
MSTWLSSPSKLNVTMVSLLIRGSHLYHLKLKQRVSSLEMVQFTKEVAKVRKNKGIKRH